jgi:hypothetical protein
MRRLLGIVAIGFVGYWLLFHKDGTVVGEARVARVSELLSAPSEFDGKRVTLDVVAAGGLGVLGIGGYFVRDADSTNPNHDLLVVSGGAGVPPAGEKLRVTGTFRQAFSMGTRQIPVMIAGW